MLIATEETRVFPSIAFEVGEEAYSCRNTKEVVLTIRAGARPSTIPSPPMKHGAATCKSLHTFRNENLSATTSSQQHPSQ